MNCRFCKNTINNTFLDLGSMPPSNAYLNEINLKKKEKRFPLKLFFCEECYLVQTEDFNKPEELFTEDYAYFSSTSSSFLDHAKKYFDEIIPRLNLNEKNFVVEIASNDGYLLKNFLESKVPCLGIEPTKSTYLKSLELNIPTLNDFFNTELTNKIISKYRKADLIIANNVYAHVPDINDFTNGIKNLLSENGVVTIEFPHLMNLIKYNQFDTVYHEHYSYLSISFILKIFQKYGLKIYDVKKLNTHGGSLRVYGCHKDKKIKTSIDVDKIVKEEKDCGLIDKQVYFNLQKRAIQVKDDLIKFLNELKKNNKKVVAYGAAAKGNTLLNYCNINTELIDYVCDASVSKQNKFLPGSHIEIKNPDCLDEDNIDYFFILPWNIKNEILKKYSYLKKKGVIFFTAINGIQFL